MSAPLILTSTDLRNLASGLDGMNDLFRKYGVTPGQYDPGLSVTTEAGDTVTLHIAFDDGALVIHDRYGS